MAFLGLVFFPTTLLSSVGLGSACAVLATVLVNLSLTPSLILLFPKFFGNIKDGCVCCAPSFCPKDGLANTKDLVERSASPALPSPPLRCPTLRCAALQQPRTTHATLTATVHSRYDRTIPPNQIAWYAD